MKRQRIFWLGCHKVLKRTELRQLRELGFEVFNPAYITPVYDQSADLRIDFDQPTTLPADVFKKLIEYDFFYTKFDDEIFEVLNEYFDAAIVTINSNWLASLLEGYEGQVIYRIYGQHFSLSEQIVSNKLWEKLVTRENFSIVPFSQESVEREHSWFLDLCTAIVPYQIPDDVFERSGTWPIREHRFEISTSIPNIQNPYFAKAYEEFNASYPHGLFRIYGPQRAAPPDSRIVGALERGALLDRFSTACGFLYNYTDSVCYLPPIEMMQLGGPVLYAPGSLLSRMYDAGAAPGLIRDPVDAETKLGRLLRQDSVFSSEVIASQEVVRRRYDRAVVKPIFGSVFRSLLGGGEALPARIRHEGAYVVAGTSKESSSRLRSVLAILLHVDGLFVHQNGKALAFEGIPRVVEMIVDVLMEFSDLDVEITCTESSLPVLNDFFGKAVRNGRVRLRPIRCGGTNSAIEGYRERLLAIDAMNKDRGIISVLVPHYYLFPEALLLKKPTLLYLPDYFPYLMPGTVFDVSAEKDKQNKSVGVAIADRAEVVLTNSSFTATYLPDAGFDTSGGQSKVVVVPLPLLGAGRASALSKDDAQVLKNKIAGRRFIFYPTANRPNKQLAFLMQLFALVRLQHPDLALVLTCDLGIIPKVSELADRYDLRSHLILAPGVDEGSLRWLYENAAALCLTSTLEGNFPPQVQEALVYGTPVVATRLPTIAEALGELTDDMLVCSPLDLLDFREKLEIALAKKQLVLDRQAKILEVLRHKNSRESFYRSFSDILARVAPHRQASQR